MQQREINSPVSIADRKNLDIRAGDNIRVWQKIQEKDAKSGKLKTRLQAFEGLCIAVKHGKEAGGTITVRKVVDGVGVERVFPIHSTAVEKFEVVKHGKVRRAKLYYLRTAKGKKARLKRKDFAAAIADEPTVEPTPEAAPITKEAPK